jgi:diacylglycerol O-acyltransferase
VHPGVVTSRTRLSAYLSRFGDNYTLALESLDSPDRAELRERATTVLARHGLDARGW